MARDNRPENRPTNIYNRVEFVDQNFQALVEGWDRPSLPRPDPRRPVRDGAPLTGRELLELFESQIVSRHLDLVSRLLRGRDQGYYTIGSAGHEGNAVIGRLTRSTDPAFLHYRSGAFVVERYRHRPQDDVVLDTLLALVASVDDPIAGGRHKIWGSRPLWILPQTSTIASHLPKAVGMAIGIRRAIKIGFDAPVPRDSIVVCSFGDASVNHSTALGALSSARRAVYQQVACPLLFVCEDNGLGISVRTPHGWVEDAFGSRRGLRYFRADGLDVVEAHRVAREAIEVCRTQARPVFLHLDTVRLLGHAGTDVELEYRTIDEVESSEARDPLLATARTVLGAGLLGPAEVRELYESQRKRVLEAAERAVERPRLTTATEVVAPLAPYTPDRVRRRAERDDFQKQRIAVFGGQDKLPEKQRPRHLGAQINAALHDLMCQYPESLLFGEDVAQKGGVYHVTAGLLKRFGHSRVFNTILDEQTILGLAQGLAYAGLLPFPEIQYLAYFHNAGDQIRGEACSMQFFSRGQFRNPMVLRIASLGYQRGFGGHFHNDNSIAALRDIPGLVLACPSRGDDAVTMLRTCTALAAENGRVVAFLEPIALYHTKDLHEPGDGGWLFDYPAPGTAATFGELRVYDGEACDLAVVTYGNGVRLSLRAARRLREQRGIATRVVDLRWLNPFDAAAVARHALDCGRVLVVDEGRRTGGIGEAIVSALVEGGAGGLPIRRLAGEDTYIPLGPAANLVLPSEESILETALTLL
jgi:2-oxoisovalerate dehydrogenase E1 component